MSDCENKEEAPPENEEEVPPENEEEVPSGVEKVEEDEEYELQKDKAPPSESDSGIEVSPYKISRKEREELYTSVLYTINHKLGANNNDSDYTEDLYEYAQLAFGMSNEEHQKFLATAQEEKPPILVLNITVVEAQGLVAKDPNGFSDPYCMLGIQPANMVERRNSSEDEFNVGGGGLPRSPGRRSFRNKLGASFKRKERTRVNSVSDTLPAKFIRTTSVKPQTLDPYWNERFRLDIEDIRTDKLHLDIWDHDDESSVFDAARKLNEVSSFKGLGRYFKQIAQSARTSTGENIDDFLGCVNIRLEDVPAAGLDRWFPLEGRTGRSSVQGQIRLAMCLGTRDSKAEEEDNWKDVLEHMELLWVFLQHELEQIFVSSQEWNGDLPQPATTILHQHAIQGNITELQQALCRWIMYSKQLMEVPLDYALVYRLLEDVAKFWGDQETPVSREEEAALAESFHRFLDYCLRILQKHRDLFPPGNEQAQHKLTYLLKCLSMLHRLRAFKRCCPFRHELHVEIANSIKKGTQDWFNVLIANAEAQQITDSTWPIQTLVDFTNNVNSDLYKGHVYYHKQFESFTGVSFSTVVYKQLEKMLGESLGSRIQESCSAVEFDSEDADPESEYMAKATLMFELYMSLQEFLKFREKVPSDEKKHPGLANYHLWFKDAVQHWFVVAQSKAQVRLRKAVELDKIAFLDNYVRHSSSAVDAATCFVQIKQFWRQLNWPEPAGAFTFATRVIETICSGTAYYAVLCQQKLQYIEGELNQDITEQQCIMANNIDWVLKTLSTLEEELGIHQIIKTLDVNQGATTADQCRDFIHDTLTKAEADVVGTIVSILTWMIEKMRPELKKLIFHLAWAPEKLDAENAIRPLLDKLDSTLHQLYSRLIQSNFDRLLNIMWKVLVHELQETTNSNIGKESLTFFERLFASLAILVEFFHSSGKGLSLESMKNEKYEDLFRMLKMHKTGTLQLIDQYISQRLEDQQQTEKCQYGVLTIKASYNQSVETLHVEVLNAKELVPLDPTGFSDPYVIVDLVPRHLFPGCSKQRTKVQKKTLYPLFDETFQFRVNPDLVQRHGACLLFSVMDYDMMTKNDFEGEAYLPLATVPNSDDDDAGRLIEMNLIHPDEKDEIIAALLARTWDKEAQEFVKNLKHRRKNAQQLDGEEEENNNAEEETC